MPKTRKQRKIARMPKKLRTSVRMQKRKNRWQNQNQQEKTISL